MLDRVPREIDATQSAADYVGSQRFSCFFFELVIQDFGSRSFVSVQFFGDDHMSRDQFFYQRCVLLEEIAADNQMRCHVFAVRPEVFFIQKQFAAAFQFKA
jgi:hypothetical protein